MSGPSSSQLELQYTQHLLACLIFEIQANWVEKEGDPPGDLFDRLIALAEQAPSAVMPLVEHLKRTIPQERLGESYTYSFPFVEWRGE